MRIIGCAWSGFGSGVASPMSDGASPASSRVDLPLDKAEPIICGGGTCDHGHRGSWIGEETRI